MAFTIENVDWQSSKNRLSKLREQVFVLEWHIPQHAEFDDRDYDALHVLLLDTDKNPVATGRLTQDGEIGRIAVRHAYRSPEIYRALFSSLAELGKSVNVPYLKVVCSLESVEKHRVRGFEPEGRVFMEAGIPRQRMRCPTHSFIHPDAGDLH